MNGQVRKDINGRVVVARPVYKGGVLPAYWVGTVNERTLPVTFASAPAVFGFVQRSARAGATTRNPKP